MLLLINHQSFLDPLLVGVPLARPVSFLARDSLFRIPVVGWILRKTYVLPINRESAGTNSIRMMIERLNAGYWIGMFPEGTRSSDGSIGEIKPGFLAILRRSQVPVCPVAIAGARQSLGKRSKFIGRGNVRVIFGEPISAGQIAEVMKQGEAAVIGLIRERLDGCVAQLDEWMADD